MMLSAVSLPVTHIGLACNAFPPALPAAVNSCLIIISEKTARFNTNKLFAQPVFFCIINLYAKTDMNKGGYY